MMDAYNDLVDNYGYSTNIINLKITQPSDDNFSDDELTFLPYFTYLYSGILTSEMEEEFQLSIQRTWNVERPNKSPLWNFIYSLTNTSDFALKDSIWTLQTYPLSQINWPVKNGDRLDIFH